MKKLRNVIDYCINNLILICTISPTCFIFLLIAWSYCTTIFLNYPSNVKFTKFGTHLLLNVKLLFILIYHFVLIILVWSLWKSFHSKPATIPKQYYLTISETRYFINLETKEDEVTYLQHLVKCKGLSIYTCQKTLEPKFCNICFLFKPDRTHHCSQCKRCIPKMDHHCPWISNCVGYHNQKYFILFISYASIYCSISCLNVLYVLNDLPKNNISGVLQLFLLLILSGILSIPLMLLTVFNIFLVYKNKTTLELFTSPTFRDPKFKRQGFNLHFVDNFKQIFGNSFLLWFVPLFSSEGDGISFPLHLNVSDNDRINLLSAMEDYV